MGAHGRQLFRRDRFQLRTNLQLDGVRQDFRAQQQPGPVDFLERLEVKKADARIRAIEFEFFRQALRERRRIRLPGRSRRDSARA